MILHVFYKELKWVLTKHQLYLLKNTKESVFLYTTMINMGHVMRYNDVGRKCSNITCSQLILAHDHEINRNVMKTDLRFLGTTRYNQIFKPMSKYCKNPIILLGNINSNFIFHHTISHLKRRGSYLPIGKYKDELSKWLESSSCT